MRRIPSLLFCATLVLGVCAPSVQAIELGDAVESITTATAKKHVHALADDLFEGREAGSRGGRAAAIYLVKELQKHGIQGGGAKGSFYQPFGSGYSNVLGLAEGRDPELKKQVIVVSAHYDHVGYGTQRNSYGPIGLIHNGADDNASGVAGLLEVVAAFSRLPERPKRSVLFAFWDGEEKGLLGSKHWVESPTTPLKQVPLMVNMDMIGRLRANRIDVFGSRTAPGLRRLLSSANQESGLTLDFTWEMKENSDHYTFYNRQIPVLMLHTGMHGDYHRPSDDPEKINADGLRRVACLLFGALVEAAEVPGSLRYRPASRAETTTAQETAERPLPAPAGRLSIHWDSKASADGGIVLTRLTPSGPAARAGMRSGDKIVKFAGRDITSAQQFRAVVLAAVSPATAVVERADEKQPLEFLIRLPGKPTRLGVSWREDDAEPGCLILTRVIPGSAADVAGLKANDRIYQVAGQDFANAEAFRRIATQARGELTVLVESEGHVRSATLRFFDEPVASENSGDE